MQPNSDDSLPQLLRKWAEQEMGFIQPRDQNEVSVSGYMQQICRGDKMVDVWKFILKSVRSIQTVKKIQGNLMLHNHKGNSFGSQVKESNTNSVNFLELVQARDQMSDEVTHLLKDLGHLERDVHRLEEELCQAETDYQSLTSGIADLERQACLLNVFSRKSAETLEKNVDYTKHIKTRASTISERANIRNIQLFSSKSTAATQIDSTAILEEKKNYEGLETACERQVRETCQSIGTFLQQALQGYFGKDTASFQQHKQGLWTSVESVMAEFSVNAVLQALVSNTLHATAALHTHTAGVNIYQDALRLRFKYEQSGKLTDLSAPPTLLTSVHQLLEEAQLAHIRRFLATESHKNVTWQDEQLLEQNVSSVAVLLKDRLKDSQHLKLSRALVDSELTLAAERMALQVLQAEVNELTENLYTIEKQQEALITKFQRIQDFKNIADKKQDLIRVLAKQNANAKSRLDAQQKEIQEYIQRMLLHHKQDVDAMTLHLHCYITKEADKFVSLPLPLLLLVYFESEGKIPVIDMSINHVLKLTTADVHQSLKDALRFLEFPQYKAAEQIMPYCVCMKQATDDAESLSQLLDHTASALRKSGPHQQIGSDGASALARDIEEHDRKQVNRLLPPVQHSIEKAKGTSMLCLLIRKHLEYWWEQPAQFTVPWVTVDQATFSQWFDKWKMAVTKLRQMPQEKKM